MFPFSYVVCPDVRFGKVAATGDLETLAATLSDAGYDGMEIALRDPREIDAANLLAILDKYSLKVPALGTGIAFWSEGLHFSSPDGSVRAASVERIKCHIELAAQLDAIVIIGLILGKDPVDDTHRALAAECLLECGTAAADAGVRLAVEPINRYETAFVNTVGDCLDFIGQSGAPACGLLLDSFHMNIEEASIQDAIRLAGDRCIHFHAADSNRRWPGQGHIDFPSIFDTLTQIGFKGFISAEIHQEPDSSTAISGTAAYLKQFA